MHATVAPKCETLSMASKCFVVNGEDLFAEFLDTLIDPPVPAGITPEMALSIWIMITEQADDLDAKQKAVAEAFALAESPNELADRWADLIGE